VHINLLDNAIKFSPPESEISLELTAEAGNAVLRVHNRGLAIPEGRQEQIFEKFQRVQRVGHRETTGTGLGLAISKALVEAHGGRIWTRNEADGVAFYVALPLSGAVAVAELSLR
jgi:two-component system sensor histidine kinase KdpD